MPCVQLSVFHRKGLSGAFGRAVRAPLWLGLFVHPHLHELPQNVSIDLPPSCGEGYCVNANDANDDGVAQCHPIHFSWKIVS
jgi:hypothetical protein